jgi:hypothetical protein
LVKELVGKEVTTTSITVTEKNPFEEDYSVAGPSTKKK